MNSRNTIGIIELASIHKGFEVQDVLLKMVHIEKILARTICSGKYLIIMRGEIADVEEGISLARQVGGFAIIDALTIANVDERIFPALAGSTMIESPEVDGLLIIETFSVASAIKAGDYALKESDISILRIHAAMAVGGKGFMVITGNIDALKSSVLPAIDFLKEEGMLAGYSLITHPHPEVLRDLL
jgi:microcompartment protein CcmL/EutN